MEVYIQHHLQEFNQFLFGLLFNSFKFIATGIFSVFFKTEPFAII